MNKHDETIRDLKKWAIILGIIWTLILIGDKVYSGYINRVVKQFKLSQRVEANEHDLTNVKDDIKIIRQDIKILIRRK